MLTEMELKNNPQFIGEHFPLVTLFYPLSATQMPAEHLGEILGLKKVKHVYQHQTCLGKLILHDMKANII